MLLLPGDRVRDQPRAEAGRGRGPGAAQIAARLSAGADLQRALDPRPGFRRAVAAFLDRERQMVEHKIEQLAEFSPFRHADPEPPE